jgi:hypothetical protein
VAFVGEHGMVPIRSVWERSRHAWLTVPTAIEHFDRGRP